MTDNDLIKLFCPIIESGLTAGGYDNVQLIQSNQPTQQGAANSPAVHFYKIGDRRYGFLRREDKWDSEFSRMAHEETQYYETTFQVSALVIQNVNNTAFYTASDLVNEVLSILQSNAAIEQLKTENVGILRITDVRNPYFTDDRDQFEASPNFDFTLTYERIRISASPVIESINLDIHRV